MNDNRVTQEHIDALIKASNVEVEHRKYGNMTLVNLTTPWGFHITETSACIDPENYSEEIGEAICMSRIEQQLWQLEGYFKMKDDYRKDKPSVDWAVEYGCAPVAEVCVSDDTIAKCVSNTMNRMLALAT